VKHIYPLPTYAGSVLLDLRLAKSIRRSKRPPSGGGVTLIIRLNGGDHIEPLHFNTDAANAHALIEHFNKHFKDKTMNKLSDFIDFTASNGNDVRLYAQDVMRVDMHPGDDESSVKLNVIFQNGRTRGWMLGSAVGHLVQDWLNAHHAILDAVHTDSESKWVASSMSAAPTRRVEVAEPKIITPFMKQVYETVEREFGQMLDMAHGEKLIGSAEFRKDFTKSLMLTIGTVARAVAVEECGNLKEHLTADDIKLPDEDAQALDAAKFFASKLGVPVGEVNVIRIDAGEAPQAMIDAVRKAMGERKFEVKPDGLNDDALNCLRDVVSHQGDFMRAISAMQAVCEATSTSDDHAYWEHQKNTLKRMVAQASTALKKHHAAVGK
jgi:hypothetical protein